jgi:hypothetical protein
VGSGRCSGGAAVAGWAARLPSMRTVTAKANVKRFIALLLDSRESVQ